MLATISCLMSSKDGSNPTKNPRLERVRLGGTFVCLSSRKNKIDKNKILFPFAPPLERMPSFSRQPFFFKSDATHFFAQLNISTLTMTTPSTAIQDDEVERDDGNNPSQSWKASLLFDHV